MEQENSPFKRINGAVAYLGPTVSPQGVGPGITLSTPSTKYSFLRLDAQREIENNVTNWDLIRLWPHRTRPSINGRNATESKIMAELQRNGYSLDDSGKWKKQPTLPEESSDEVSKRPCYHRTDERVTTHRGSFCGGCGKKF